MQSTPIEGGIQSLSLYDHESVNPPSCGVEDINNGIQFIDMYVEEVRKLGFHIGDHIVFTPQDPMTMPFTSMMRCVNGLKVHEMARERMSGLLEATRRELSIYRGRKNKKMIDYTTRHLGILEESCVKGSDVFKDRIEGFMRRTSQELVSRLQPSIQMMIRDPSKSVMQVRVSLVEMSRKSFIWMISDRDVVS